MRTLESLDEVRSKTIIVRADLNVPISKGRVTDDGRIRASLGTIHELVKSGARVVAISHLGRPSGPDETALSLKPVAIRMEELLGSPVAFVSETVGERARAARSQLQDGQVLLLENLRFNAGETSTDTRERLTFARELAIGADAFVSDGFGVVHRRQASVTDLATLLPSVAGRLVEQETEVLERLIDHPERPSVVVLGGSKVSDKLGVIDHLIDRVDTILIGGGMMFTFLAANGADVGKSLLEEDQIENVRGYLKRAEALGVDIVLPTDVVVAESFAADAAHEVVDSSDIESSAFGAQSIGLDIGPATAQTFAAIIESANTVFWNGPMGVFEMQAFSHGTRAVAAALVNSQGFTVVGGGDSAAAVRALGFEDGDFNHISTGGGASLEFIEGKILPGLEVLS